LKKVRTDDGGFQVDEHGARHVLSSASLAEEGVEAVVAAADGLVGGHLSVGLDAVFQAVQLPAGVANLHASLADVDGNAFALHTTRIKMLINIFNGLLNLKASML